MSQEARLLVRDLQNAQNMCHIRMEYLLVMSDVLLCRHAGVVCGCGLERYNGHGGLYSKVYL